MLLWLPVVGGQLPLTSAEWERASSKPTGATLPSKAADQCCDMSLPTGPYTAGLFMCLCSRVCVCVCMSVKERAEKIHLYKLFLCVCVCSFVFMIGREREREFNGPHFSFQTP